MMRVFVPLLALAAVCNGILPEIVHSGISHILEDHSVMGQNELDRMFVKVEQLPGDPQHKPEDAFHQKNESANTHPNDLPSSPHNETAADKVTDSVSVHGTSVDQETNNITTSEQTSDLGNNIYQGCSSDKDCGKDMFCLSDDKNSKCLPCKTTDVPCTKDEVCCGEQLCVWGQCTQNATKGESGSTCQSQSDCGSDLCCAFHKTLLFPICSAKPIEREQCYGASNHLMALLSWDVQDEGPRKHCPCAGNLHCQHLGRGSMCLKGEDSSEEDLTDTLYSEIDYII